MSFIDTLLHQFHEHLERQRNQPFLRATMAACAMVASADGDVSFAQRVRVDQILETLDRLKVFDPHEGVNLFNEFTDEILAHSEEGHKLAMQAVIQGTPDAAVGELLIRVCCAVSEINAGPDGNKALADQIEIVTLCSKLGVEPKACGLYVDDPDFPDAG